MPRRNRPIRVRLSGEGVDRLDATFTVLLWLGVAFLVCLIGWKLLVYPHTLSGRVEAEQQEQSRRIEGLNRKENPPPATAGEDFKARHP